VANIWYSNVILHWKMSQRMVGMVGAAGFFSKPILHLKVKAVEQHFRRDDDNERLE